MKRTYIQPSIEVTVLDTENIMQRASVIISNDEEIGKGGESTGNDWIDAKEHINAWNMWDDEEEY